MATGETIGRPMEILMIEDSLSDARLAIEALQRGKLVHRMTLMRDGEEALEFIRREGIYTKAPRPDLVLLDLGLPKLDGRTLLQEIKQDENLRSIPVVIMTVFQDDDQLLRSQLSEVDGYLHKPVDFEAFVQLVHQLRQHWLADVILPDQT